MQIEFAIFYFAEELFREECETKCFRKNFSGKNAKPNVSTNIAAESKCERKFEFESNHLKTLDPK